MSSRRCSTTILAAIIALSLAGCVSAPREPWPTPSSSTTQAEGDVALDLSPVPARLMVPANAEPALAVAGLTGPDITAMAPDAAVQVSFLASDGSKPMVGNVLWFTVGRYTELIASVDAPKGIEVGIASEHVLFVQPALDMPFDPASADGVAYGSLVERVRAFRWYSSADAAAPLLRPCPVPDAWPTTPLTADMRAAIDAFFTTQGLLPVTVARDPWVLDVDAQSKGTHECANPDGGMGGYVGAVPIGSTDAVMVLVHHAPYAVTGASDTFVTLARGAAGAWSVVSEGTGP